MEVSQGGPTHGLLSVLNYLLHHTEARPRSGAENRLAGDIILTDPTPCNLPNAATSRERNPTLGRFSPLLALSLSLSLSH